MKDLKADMCELKTDMVEWKAGMQKSIYWTGLIQFVAIIGSVVATVKFIK